MKKISAVILILIAVPVVIYAAYTPDLGNGTVYDSVTQLTWAHCTLGQTGNDCSGGTATLYWWVEAIQACENLDTTASGGYNDWRLPNVKELNSLILYSFNTRPRIDTTAFPNTKATTGDTMFYWSSTSLADSNHMAWIAKFWQGQTQYAYKDDSERTDQIKGYVRCVRGPE